MESKIKAMIPQGNDFLKLEIFGHSGHGLPGLEILGLGNRGRIIKEKLIFVTRMNKMKMAQKRYVLCVELDTQPRDSDGLRFLELPLLILFWSLAGVIPIKRLDNCVGVGKLNLEGVPIPPEQLDQYTETQFNLLALTHWPLAAGQNYFPLEELCPVLKSKVF